MESPELRRSKRRRTSTKHSDEVVSTNIGKTIHWKGIEKERLLEALKRSANLENYKHIARSVKTKSVEEVKAYMELMKRKARMAAVTNEDSIIMPTPLQKWLTLSKELAGLTPLDYSVEIGNVLTLAHLEGEKPAQTDTLLENSSLPLPDYSKIYMYLSDMMAGREVSPSSLSLTEAWVLNDLLQLLESEINQADTKEQEAFMQQRYQWLICKLYAGDADIELDPSVAKEHTGILVPLSSISRIRNNNGQSGTGAVPKATATATSALAPPSHTASAPSAAANKDKTVQSTTTLTSTEQVLGTAAASCPEVVTPASMVATSSSAASNSVVDADSILEKGTSSGTSAVASASASHSSASEPAMPVDMGASLTTLNVTPPDVAQPSTEGVVQKQNAMGIDAYNKDTNNVHVNTDINGSKGSQLPVAAIANSLPPLSTTTNAARQSESKSSPSAGVSGERLQHSVTAQAVPNNAVTNSASAQTATEIIASAGPTTATMTTAMSAQQTSSTTTTRSAVSAEEATATAASDNTAANDNKKKKRLVVPKSGIATLNPFSVPIKLLNILQPPSTNTNNDC